MRTQNSMKNASVALIGQILSLFISFVARIVFLKMLNAEYLGINGLFTNILMILSLVEMGFGPAIVYSLYKPLAENNISKTKALMKFYSNVYKIIGILILLLGLAILPFIGTFIKDTPNVPNLNLIYFLYLLNTVVSYFFAYKRSIIIANQKEYIVSVYNRSFFICLNIVQMIILILTGNFIFYVGLKVIFTLLENLVISRKADKLYPYIKEKNNESLSDDEKSSLYKNVRALLLHSLGSAVVNGTDNIVMSTFVGIASVGFYSNYYLVVNGITTLLTPLMSSVTASIGNLNAKVENIEKSYSVFKSLLFVNFWLYGFSMIALLNLINPFINLWIGQEYVLNMSTVFIIVINFYIKGMRKTALIFRDSKGLFYNDRFKPLFESIINIIASIILGSYFGISGIILGTIISTILTSFWIEPYIVYKNLFQINVINYYIIYFKYTLVSVVGLILTMYISSFVQTNNINSFILKICITAIVPNLLFTILFFKTNEFTYIKNNIVKIFKKDSL